MKSAPGSRGRSFHKLPGLANRVRRLRGATLALLAVALPVGAARAEDGTPLLSEKEFIAELPTVLSASRLAQPLEDAPAAVTVIDRQMIDASGARNLSELFRLVPGFEVGFYNGHRQTVTYHGLADQYSRRLQVLVDGRSVYLPTTGGVSWSDLPLALDDIERIEVIRGPNAATYGASAFLAVINIITRHSAADPGGFVRASAGSDGIRDGVLRAGGGDGDLHYRLTAAAQQDNGYAHIYDSRAIRMLTGRADYHAGGDDDLEFQFGYNDGPRGRGDYGSLSNWPHEQEIASRYEQLRWRHRLESGDEIAVQFYHNHYESDEQILTLPIAVPFPPFSVQIPVNYDIRAERYDVELQHTLGLGERARFVWGTEARSESVLWPGFLGTADPLDNHLYRLFGNLEWHATERLVFNAGAMLEKTDLTDTDFSPRVAGNYRLAPGHTLRVAMSTATRTPVLLEDQSNARFCLNSGCTIYDQTFRSTGGLHAERIQSAELGYLGRFAPGLTADVRLYRDLVTRLIGMTTRPYPDVDGNTRDFRNSDKAAILGSELQINYQPRRDTRVVFNYANTQIDSSNIDAWYSRSAPRNSASVLALRDFAADWQASTAFYYQEKVMWVDGEAIGDLRRLDLRLARRFALAGTRAEAAVVLQNVLGAQRAYLQRDIAAQVGYVTLSLRFR